MDNIKEIRRVCRESSPLGRVPLWAGESADFLEVLGLRGSTTQNRLIFQLCFIMLKIKLYVCKILCENFMQIGQKMKKL